MAVMENALRFILAWTTLTSSPWADIIDRADARTVPDKSLNDWPQQINGQFFSSAETEAGEEIDGKLFKITSHNLLLHRDLSSLRSTSISKRLARAINGETATPDHFPHGHELARDARTLTHQIPSMDVAALHRQHKEHMQILKQHQAALRHQQQLLQQRLIQNLQNTKRILAGKKPLHKTGPIQFQDNIDLDQRLQGTEKTTTASEIPLSVRQQENVATTAVTDNPLKVNLQEIFDTTAVTDFSSGMNPVTTVSSSPLRIELSKIFSKGSADNSDSSTEVDPLETSYRYNTSTTLLQLQNNVTSTLYEVTENPDDIPSPTPPAVYGLLKPEVSKTIEKNDTSDAAVMEVTGSLDDIASSITPAVNGLRKPDVVKTHEENRISDTKTSKVTENRDEIPPPTPPAEETGTLDTSTVEVTESQDDVPPPAPPAVYGFLKPDVIKIHEENGTSDTAIVEAVKAQVFFFEQSRGEKIKDEESIGNKHSPPFPERREPIDDGHQTESISFAQNVNIENPEITIPNEETEGHEFLSTSQWEEEDYAPKETEHYSGISNQEEETAVFSTIPGTISYHDETTIEPNDESAAEITEAIERPPAVTDNITPRTVGGNPSNRNSENSMGEGSYSFLTSNIESAEQLDVGKESEELMIENVFSPRTTLQTVVTPKLSISSTSPATQSRSDLPGIEDQSDDYNSKITAGDMIRIIPVIVERLRSKKLDAKDQKLLSEAYGEYWPGIVDLANQTDVDVKLLLEEFETSGPRISSSRQARESESISQSSQEYDSLYETLQEYISPDTSHDYAYEDDESIPTNSDVTELLHAAEAYQKKLFKAIPSQ